MHLIFFLCQWLLCQFIELLMAFLNPRVKQMLFVLLFLGYKAKWQILKFS